MHFLQQRDDVSPQLLQLLVGLLEFDLGVAALLLHGLGLGVCSALVRVTQRLETQLVLLEILLLQPGGERVRSAEAPEYRERERERGGRRCVRPRGTMIAVVVENL